jgi:hypothetical protein
MKWRGGVEERRITPDRWSENKEGQTIPHCCRARILLGNGPRDERNEGQPEDNGRSWRLEQETETTSFRCLRSETGIAGNPHEQSTPNLAVILGVDSQVGWSPRRRPRWIRLGSQRTKGDHGPRPRWAERDRTGSGLGGRALLASGWKGSVVTATSDQ